jgi:hypothetical protein
VQSITLTPIPVSPTNSGVSQPEVSRLFKGNFREYAVDRLMGFLTAFDRDVEIVVRKRKKAGKGGRIIFKAQAA